MPASYRRTLPDQGDRPATIAAVRNQVGVVIVGVVLALASPARADVTINLKAKDPVAALPAVSGDHQNFLRQFRHWSKGCKKPQIQVEMGTIDPTAIEPAYTSMPLVGGCGESADKYQQNVSAVNESLRDTQCASATVRGKAVQKIPAAFAADDLSVDVTRTENTINIQVNALTRTTGAWTGGRRVELPGATELHGWYLVDQDDSLQLALLFAAPDADGGITEHWVEVWLHQVPAKLGPEDLARLWLLALARNDATTLADLTAPTFERGGLEIAGDATCKKARASKTADTLTGVLACALAIAPRYATLYDEVEFEKIKATKVPKALKSYKKKIAKLAKKGAVVQFHVEQDDWDATILFVVKAGKIVGAFEAIKPL